MGIGRDKEGTTEHGSGSFESLRLEYLRHGLFRIYIVPQNRKQEIVACGLERVASQREAANEKDRAARGPEGVRQKLYRNRARATVSCTICPDRSRVAGHSARKRNEQKLFLAS